MYTRADACTHCSGAPLSLETERNRKGSPWPPPPKATCTCAHAYVLSWQHPPRGEASTCPIPEQGAGAAAHPRSQAGLTQGRGMKWEGTAAQVALLWSQDSGCLEAPKSQPLTFVLVGKQRPRGDPGLPIGAESRARVAFILLEARQKEVNTTLRRRRFTVLSKHFPLLLSRRKRMRNMKGRCEFPSYK